MLSAESASGQYPVEAVATMNRIAEEVENEPIYLSSIHVLHTEPERTGADAIAAAARQVAETLDLSAIVCWTSLGLDRPAGLARAAEAADRRHFADRRRRTEIVAGLGHPLRHRRGRARSGRHGGARLPDRVPRRFRRAGQRVIIVAGVPLGTPGATNMIRVAFVGPDNEAAAQALPRS